MPAILEQFRIIDFINWHKEKTLSINRDYQRGSVWTPAARTYLIDTILRSYPIPKIYLRTVVDVKTKKSIREVVDGQQRIETIIDFAEDKMVLGKRAEEYAGLSYSKLTPELQQQFLSYPIAVDQLLNADTKEVLEVFARLNSYGVVLNPPEKRHAKFQGDFKWAVHKSSKKWALLWERYKILSIRQVVRMYDDSLMAEMYGILLKGVCDGGQMKIDKMYREFDNNFDQDTPRKVDEILEFFVKDIAEELIGTPILAAPHFLMLFAALAHAKFGIPPGDMGDAMPTRDPRALTDIRAAIDNLRELAAVIDADAPDDKNQGFWLASSSSTQRIRSRRIRFPRYYLALIPPGL